MKINIEKLSPLLDGHNLEAETGLSKRSLDWCLSGKPCTYEAIELIAVAVGIGPKEITLVDYDEDIRENVIEFERNYSRATGTFCQPRYISRIRKLAEERPEACQIVAENKDGTIVAHFPTEWIRINPGVELTEEQKKVRAEQARNNFGID